jgi:hypothetical protein
MADDKLKRLGAFFQSGADALLAGQGDRLASAVEAIPPSRSLIDRPSYGERYGRALERRQDARGVMEDEAPAESLFGRLIGFGFSPVPKSVSVPAGIADAFSDFRQNASASSFTGDPTRVSYPEIKTPPSTATEPTPRSSTRPILAPMEHSPQVDAKTVSGPFPPLFARAIPEDVLARTSSDQPLVQWRDAGGTTHLVNNPKYEKKEPLKKAFVPPKVALVQTLKKHGVDNEYALEQLEQNPQALSELLSDLVSASNGSETLSFVLPALGRSSNDEVLNAILVAKNTGQSPEKVLRNILYDTPDPEAPNGVWPGVLSRVQNVEGAGEGSNQSAYNSVRTMSALVRSFLDEAQGKTPQAYRPVSVVGGWTGGGGVPVEQTKTWGYEPFEPDYGD